jgi:hypothetical protein
MNFHSFVGNDNQTLILNLCSEQKSYIFSQNHAYGISLLF